MQERSNNLRKRTVLLNLLALVSVAVLGGGLTGCSKDAALSKDEEQRFKNPSKEMPKEAADYMKTHGGGKPANTK